MLYPEPHFDYLKLELWICRFRFRGFGSLLESSFFEEDAARSLIAKGLYHIGKCARLGV